MTPEQPQPDTRLHDLPSPSVRVVSLALRGHRRQALESAARSGQVEVVGGADVLAAEGLPQLATRSVWLLVGSAAVYAVFIGVSRQFGHVGPLLGAGSPVLRLALLATLNVLGYIAMIPLHEAAHAAVILALGGRPRFGLRLPFAAYCTAPNQLFLRNGYLAVSLAPLIGLSLIALAVAVLAPNAAACLLLAVAGNVSGAVGDLEVVRGIRPLTTDTLIADLETGWLAYRAKRTQSV